MANNYIQFSEMIGGITPEERTWIGSQLDPDLWEAHPPDWEAPVEDGFLGFDWSLDEVEGSLWLYAEETGAPEEAARFVRAFLARFRPDDSFSLTYADHCSKPRPGEFSGGAVFVTAGSIRHEDAYDWVGARGKEHWFQ